MVGLVRLRGIKFFEDVLQHEEIASFIVIRWSYGFGGPSFAGWGSAGGYGSSGGYYGAGYGSSGGYGYSASYGSSGGYSAGYGSSGGYAPVAAYGSSGGAGSSGGVAHVGPLRRLAAKIHTHHAARAAYYGSSGGGSSGYVGVSHGSSGGYAVASHGSSGGAYGSSGGHYRSTVGYGSSGGVVSHGSSGGYSHSSYGSTGSTGSSYQSGYGSTGSVYSSGHSYGSVGSSYEVSPSYDRGVIYESAPSTSGNVIGTTPMSHSSSTESPRYNSNVTLIKDEIGRDEIQLLVDIPEEARVFVNGKPTSSKGTSRRFVSRNLESGSSYRFEVRAEQEVNGRVLSKNQTVVLTPGSTEAIAFTFEDTKPIAAETVLKLNVPADAKVTLAGNTTKSTGESRTFRTKELASGEVWNDYTITVSWNGVVKEKSIRLIGGDELAVSFGFDDLAAN